MSKEQKGNKESKKKPDQFNFIIGMNSPVDLRILQTSWSKTNKSVMLLDCMLEGIEPEVGFLIFGIRSVALVTFVR